MDKEYYDNNDNKKIIIDFIAGMTDDFFLNEVNELNEKQHIKKY